MILAQMVISLNGLFLVLSRLVVKQFVVFVIQGVKNVLDIVSTRIVARNVQIIREGNNARMSATRIHITLMRRIKFVSNVMRNVMVVREKVLICV